MPHVTVARVDAGDLPAYLARHPLKAGWTAASFSLLQSRPDAAPGRYRVVQTQQLG